MSHTVLICDDEPHVLLPLALKFKAAGYTVLQADNGAAAWQMMEQEVPSIVLTDYTMPHLDGLQLVERMRQHPETRDVPAILVTARGFELSEQELKDRIGVSALIVKPFSPREVVNLTTELLNNLHAHA